MLAKLSFNNVMFQKHHFKTLAFVFLFFCFFVFLLTVAAPALAADTGAAAVRERVKNVAEGVGYLPAPTDSGAAAGFLTGFFGKITRGALVLLGVLFFALVVYGGIMHLTAGGNEEQVKKSTKIIVRGLVGLLIVIFAGAITQFLMKLTRPVCPEGEVFDSAQGVCATEESD